MLKSVNYDGKPKDNHTYLRTAHVLKELENDLHKEYIVGVDYGTNANVDYTTVTYFTRDQHGFLVLEGSKQF